MIAELPNRHLLGIAGLTPPVVSALLDRAEILRDTQHEPETKRILQGRTLVNLFFEASTRTRTSFELAGKRLGADVVNMATEVSAVKKGETLIDTAATLNAMRIDALVVRHAQSGAVHRLAEAVQCAVVNGGDGTHEHPTQALLDALTIRRARGRIEGLTITIVGDIAHSRVARSNILLLSMMGANLRLVAPPTLLPAGADRLGAEIFQRLDDALPGSDIVMALRLQTERMSGSFVPSPREFFRFYGMTRERLNRAGPEALVMHPGPINRGVEIAGDLADDPDRSLIQTQVELGVAIRMACLEALASRPSNQATGRLA